MWFRVIVLMMDGSRACMPLRGLNESQGLAATRVKRKWLGFN